jgi:hypothetical protein
VREGDWSMKNIVSSFVLRVSQPVGEQDKEDYRIRIRHVQSDEEIYLSSLEEIKDYISVQLKREQDLLGVRKGVADDR